MSGDALAATGPPAWERRGDRAMTKTLTNLGAGALFASAACGARTTLPPGPEPETPFLWSERFGGPGEDAALDLVVDADGGVLVTGYIGSPVDFGTGAIGVNVPDDAPYHRQIFAARFDADGRARWARAFGLGEGRAIARSPDGDVIVTGRFVDSADFGGGAMTALRPPGAYFGDVAQDAFVARLHADGSHVWSRSFGDVSFGERDRADSERGDDVAVDPDGRVLVVGFFDGRVDFGGGVLESAGRAHTFVAKLEASGAPAWTRTMGRTDVGDRFSLATNAAGEVLLGGSFRRFWRPGDVGLEALGLSDVVIEKLGPDGDRRWTRAFGSADWDSAGGVVATDDGGVAITGTYAGDVDFDVAVLGAAFGNKDVFLARLDALGGVVSATRAGGARDDEGAAIARGEGAHLLVTGNFEETFDYGGPPITSQGNYDVFVMDADAASGTVTARAFGGDRDQFGTALGVDARGDVLVAGYFGGTVDFGDGPLPSAGAEDIFLAKLAP
jgi:hypothetical protein